MPHLRLPSLPAVAVLCGATLLGWSLGGVASVDRSLQAVTPPARAPHDHLVLDRARAPHGQHAHHEL